MKMASVAAGTAMHVRITASVVKPDDLGGSVLSPVEEPTSTSLVWPVQGEIMPKLPLVSENSNLKSNHTQIINDSFSSRC
jgi:hypothetical protein